MRAIVGVLGLLVVVAIVGVLANKQRSTGAAPQVTGSPPGSSGPATTPKQQVQQFEQAVQGAVQQARPMPDNDK